MLCEKGRRAKNWFALAALIVSVALHNSIAIAISNDDANQRNSRLTRLNIRIYGSVKAKCAHEDEAKWWANAMIWWRYQLASIDDSCNFIINILWRPITLIYAVISHFRHIECIQSPYLGTTLLHLYCSHAHTCRNIFITSKAISSISFIYSIGIW